MDFGFSLAEIFPTEIVRIGCDMLPQGGLPPGSPYSNKTMGQVQQKIMEIIDVMGQASAVAQVLKAPITSATKVRNMQEHIVYLLVDFANNAVVGLLKVGKKNLFLLDRRGEQHEVCPMCILDFYVHESRQRSGCGRKLFEHMLAEQNMHPRHMAIDRPSPKLLGFLKKYYDLKNIINQVNNYVIYEGFFNNDLLECSPSQKRARIYMGKLQYV